VVRDELRMRRLERMQTARLPGKRKAGLSSWRCFDFHLQCTEEGREMGGDIRETEKSCSR